MGTQNNNLIKFKIENRVLIEFVIKQYKNKIVKDNDPALLDSFGLSSLSTSKHGFVNCFNET